jgi:xylose isomerase
MLERRTLEPNREQRYAGWDGELGKGILGGQLSMHELAERVASGAIDPTPISGGQELLEEMVNRRIWQVDRDR